MRAQVLTALITVQAIFGTLPVAAKPALDSLPPAWYAFLRVALAAAVFVAITHGILRKEMPHGRYHRLALYGLLGVTLNIGLYMEGLQRSTATNAVILITVIPVYTYGVAMLLGKERFSRIRSLGLVSAFIGVLLLLDLGAIDTSPDTVLGNILLAINTFSYALYLVVSKEEAQEVDPFVFITWVFVPAALMLLPYALLHDWPATVPGLAWASLGYVVIGPTLTVYLLNIIALRHVPASTVAVFIFLQPLVGALLANVLLGEVLTARHLVSAALIGTGLALVWARSHRRWSRPREL